MMHFNTLSHVAAGRRFAPVFRRWTLPAVILVAMPVAAFAQVSVLGELIRDARAKPGETIKGVIVLQNGGDKPADVRTYQTDYLCYADGRNIYGDPGSVPRSDAAWVTVSPKRVTVPPKQTANIEYTVQVPADEKLSGTYWSMVMVEPLAAESVESTGAKLNPNDMVKFGIRTVLRYGVQIVIDVGNGGVRKLKITDRKLVVHEGKRVLQLDIENTGDHWLRPTLWTELFNAGGASVGRFEGGQLHIYPGCSLRQRIDLSPVPKGKYKAQVIFDNGDENVYGAQYDLDLQ